MIKFYKDTTTTYTDIKNQTSLMIYSINGCNLKCYKCHVYDELITPTHNSFLSCEDILDLIKSNGYLYDCIIFSGGEFLINDIFEIEELLKEIRLYYEGKIIINSNGTFPYKMKYVLLNHLADGVYLDIKGIVENEELYKVIGVNYNKYIPSIKKSIDIVNDYNYGYSQFRTVKYPFVSEEYFKIIQEYIKDMSVEYVINDFVIGEDM